MPNNDFFDLEGETAIRPPLLQAGRVTNVNQTTHTYDVETDNKYNLINLPVMYPYVSNQIGNGINFVAEVGTRCIVCNTINGEDFILGWIVPVGTATIESVTNIDSAGGTVQITEIDQKNADSYPGRSGNRSKDLIPGDIELKAPSNNRIRVLNGGLIELVSADGQLLSQYIPQPGENLLFTKADIIQHLLGAGSFSWSTDNENRLGSLFFELKSNIDEDPDLFIEAGSIPGEEDQRLIIKVGNQDSPAAKISLSKIGDLAIECKNATIDAEKDIKVNCKNANVKAKSNVKITATGGIDLN